MIRHSKKRYLTTIRLRIPNGIVIKIFEYPPCKKHHEYRKYKKRIKKETRRLIKKWWKPNKKYRVKPMINVKMV